MKRGDGRDSLGLGFTLRSCQHMNCPSYSSIIQTNLESYNSQKDIIVMVVSFPPMPRTKVDTKVLVTKREDRSPFVRQLFQDILGTGRADESSVWNWLGERFAGHNGAVEFIYGLEFIDMVLDDTADTLKIQDWVVKEYWRRLFLALEVNHPACHPTC